jgi:hypothetical protein
MTRIFIAIPTVAGAVLAASVAAAAPVALVEDITGNPAGVEFMDYLDSGKVIKLAPRDTIVLAYLASCVRETITGGTVTIGAKESDVQAGKVERTTVQCDAGKILSPPDFAGGIFRGAPSSSTRASGADAQLIIYGRSPIVELKAPGTLTIERIDQPGERHVVKIEKEHLLRGRFYDFAKQGKTLAAGGTYRASLGGQEIVFKIDPGAKPGNTPILGRLLRLGSPS